MEKQEGRNLKYVNKEDRGQDRVLYKSENRIPRRMYDNVPQDVVEIDTMVRFLGSLPIDILKRITNFTTEDTRNIAFPDVREYNEVVMKCSITTKH